MAGYVSCIILKNQIGERYICVRTISEYKETDFSKE